LAPADFVRGLRVEGDGAVSELVLPGGAVLEVGEVWLRAEPGLGVWERGFVGVGTVEFLFEIKRQHFKFTLMKQLHR
jgi:hypothetical protein